MNRISDSARRTQNEVRQFVKDQSLPLGKAEIIGTQTPCCANGKYIAGSMGEITRTQIIFCNVCGRRYFRVVDHDVTSPWRAR